jgi:general secretion pathway protein H
MESRKHRGLASRESAGFTLVELLVVIAILGLLMALALPSIGSRGPADLRAVVQNLSADLRLLRNDAIRQDATITFVPFADGYVVRPSGQIVRLPAGVALSFESFPLRLLPDTHDWINFFPDGTSTGGALTLKRGGSTVKLLVRGLNGQVELRE